MHTRADPLERPGSDVTYSPGNDGTSPSYDWSGPSALGLGQLIFRDGVLRIAFLVLGLLIAYQTIVTLLHPTWIGVATDWFRAGLAWPQLAVSLGVCIWLTRVQRRVALSWWFFSAAMLSYTIARTLWTFDDRFIYPDHVPFPTLPDLFFLLQYPFFLLALIALPGDPPWDLRLKAILDCFLLIGAASALSWYFLLAPIYLMSGESLLGKVVNLIYTVGDLGMIFGLSVALIYRQSHLSRAVLGLLILAFLCLVLADTWAASILVYPSHVYGTGHPPDVFWNAFYLLLPLAGLVQVRLTQHTQAGKFEMLRATEEHPSFQREDFQEVIRVLSPLIAAVLACVAIAVRAILAPVVPAHPLVPILIIFGLLVLVLVRQGIAVLEMAQLRRRWALGLASEQAIRETNRRMESFLGIASHELKTPLTSVTMSLQILLRRALRGVYQQGNGTNALRARIDLALKELELPLQQAGRLNRLVNELLDTSRIQAGRLELALKPENLVDIARTTVEEQRQLFPERTIILHLPEGPLSVVTDADRVGQVLTNYLTNALKYSPEEHPVEIGLHREDRQGRVWVRDQGPGIPEDGQGLLWERFHRVKGIDVQSGSGIGLGLGLYISKTIIEEQNGQVGVQSTPGHGSTFWFTLPLTVSEQA